MSRRFIIIPAIALDMPDLKANDLKILCAIGAHTDRAGWCNLKQQTIADRAGFSRSYVCKRLKVLEDDLGLIEQHHQTRSHRGQVASHYRLIFDIDVPPDDDVIDAEIDARADVPLEHTGGADVFTANTPDVFTANTPMNGVLFNDLEQEVTPAREVEPKTKAEDITARVLKSYAILSDRFGLPKVRVFNNARRTAIKARFIEVGKDETVFGELFNKIAASDFLTGQATDFKADLDFIFAPQSFAKILEGRYDNTRKTGGRDAERKSTTRGSRRPKSELEKNGTRRRDAMRRNARE